MRLPPDTIKFESGCVVENAASPATFSRNCHPESPLQRASPLSNEPAIAAFGSVGWSAPLIKRATERPPFLSVQGPLFVCVAKSPASVQVISVLAAKPTQRLPRGKLQEP